MYEAGRFFRPGFEDGFACVFRRASFALLNSVGMSRVRSGIPFRLPLADPLFSSGSALWLSQHGARRTKRNNLTCVLLTGAMHKRITRTRLAHRPQGHRPLVADLGMFWNVAIPYGATAATSLVQRNSVPSHHMRRTTTARCQCRAKFPQKCRSKFLKFGRSGHGGRRGIFRWSTAGPEGGCDARRRAVGF